MRTTEILPTNMYESPQFQVRSIMEAHAGAERRRVHCFGLRGAIAWADSEPANLYRTPLDATNENVGTLGMVHFTADKPESEGYSDKADPLQHVPVHAGRGASELCM